MTELNNYLVLYGEIQIMYSTHTQENITYAYTCATVCDRVCASVLKCI